MQPKIIKITIFGNKCNWLHNLFYILRKNALKPKEKKINFVIIFIIVKCKNKFYGLKKKRVYDLRVLELKYCYIGSIMFGFFDSFWRHSLTLIHFIHITAQFTQKSRLLKINIVWIFYTINYIQYNNQKYKKFKFLHLCNGWRL